MGKTTLLRQLAALGHTCFPESGRAIIRQQLATGGTALPWQDREAFAGLMFRQGLADYNIARMQKGLLFFDRGLPDVTGYLELNGLLVPPEMEHAAHLYRYHPLVAMTPPWKEIYVNDAERKQSFEEAIATYDVMRSAYLRYGYHPFDLPLVGVKQRAAYLLARMKALR